MIKRIFAPAVAALLAALIVYGFVPPPRQAAAGYSNFDVPSTWTPGGTANAIILNVVNVSVFAGAGVPALNEILGVPIHFIPIANNTGPVTIVLQSNLGTSSAIPLRRPSSIGLVALSLNELWAAEPTSVMYDGTEFVLSSNLDMTRIGDTVEMRGSTASRGTLIEDGSCVSQTQFAALFSVIGTNYGSCSAGLFKLPRSNGEAFVAMDTQGANGAANRITTAGSGCNATTIGDCGNQNQTLTAAQIPANLPYTDPGHAHSYVEPNAPTGGQTGGGSFAAVVGVTSGTTGGSTTGITINPSGGAAHPILPPISLGLRAIKY